MRRRYRAALAALALTACAACGTATVPVTVAPASPPAPPNSTTALAAELGAPLPAAFLAVAAGATVVVPDLYGQTLEQAQHTLQAPGSTRVRS